MRGLVLVIGVLACAAAPLDERWSIIGPGGGGATWRIFNLGEPVQFFVFDPLDANAIYASAGAGGVFRSGDAGATWQRYFPRNVQKITMGDDHASGLLHTTGEP